MKSWVLKYNLFILMGFVLFSCSEAAKNPFLKSEQNTISIASECRLEAFDFYSNDAFSKLIKDLVCDPVFYYDENSGQVKSAVISSYRWVHESEIALKVNTAKVFHDSPVFRLDKGRYLSAGDIAHSIRLFAKNSKYPQVKAFLSTFQKLTPAGDDELIISLEKNVSENDFLRELAAIELFVVPKELKKIEELKDLIGTALYSVSAVSREQVHLKVFKNHALFKQKGNGDFSYPNAYRLNLNIPKNKLLHLFTSGQVDGIFTSDISEAAKKFKADDYFSESFFVRKEDEITVLAINFEKSFTSSYPNIEFIKAMVNPEKHNQSRCQNQLIHYYSLYDLENYDAHTITSLDMYFDNVNQEFESFVRKNFAGHKINLSSGTDFPDVLIYRLMLPSVFREQTDKYILQYYASKGFINDEKISKEANIKLFSPAKYLLFNEKIKFLNGNFDTRNDFSCIFKVDN
ncbi:MAG: hypothetical protein J0G96_11195 [Flavobacteriia bacterium]|nr:hypothetical protein [Flavobacteriia bacterium]